MRRRQVLAMLGSSAALWPLRARAQQPAKVTIGFLSTGGEPGSPNIAAFEESMRQYGHVSGRTVEIAYRFAHGYQDRLPALAAELVAMAPRVIVTGSTSGARATQA